MRKARQGENGQGEEVTPWWLQQMGQCFNLTDGSVPLEPVAVSMAFVEPGKEINHAHVYSLVLKPALFSLKPL